MTVISPLGDLAVLAVGGLLIVGTLAGEILRLTARSDARRHLSADWRARTAGWWGMCLLLFGAMALGVEALSVLFALISFRALREFITLTPTRRGDHGALFWAFFVVLPLHYVLVALPWYDLAAIFVPVWAFLLLSVISAVAGDPTRYLERTAKVQWGLMCCVYALGHIPLLASMQLATDDWKRIPSMDPVIWLLLVVQLSDVMQYVWGKALGRHPVMPTLSPKKTWEGLILGILSAAGIGAALHGLTPCLPWEAFLLALGLCLAGFGGGLVMSAVKRDARVKDWSHLIPGHGGILDRVDSLVVAGPIGFHVLNYYWSIPTVGS